jgi:hypothetical protein
LLNSPIFSQIFSDDPVRRNHFLGIGVDLAKSNRSLWIDQTFTLYSMSFFWSSWHCKELLIGINNKIGSYNLYVVNVRFHLNVFSTQVRVSPYILKRGSDSLFVGMFWQFALCWSTYSLFYVQNVWLTPCSRKYLCYYSGIILFG